MSHTTLMKRTCKLCTFSIVLFIISSFIKPVNAADYTVTCTTDGCDSPSTPLFQELSAVPGESVSKSLTIQNDRPETIDVSLSTKQNSDTDEDFLDAVDVSIKKSDGTVIDNRILSDFLGGGTIPLEEIPARQYREYSISLLFRKNSPNTYQGKQANFDIVISIEGDSTNKQEETTTSTRTSNSSESHQSVSGITTVFAALNDSVGSVLGSDSTSHVKIDELFSPRDNILGATACEETNILWWLPLAVQTGISFVSIVRTRDKPYLRFLYFIIVVIASVLSYVIHRFFGCGCSPRLWCLWYGYVNILILVLTMLILTSQTTLKQSLLRKMQRLFLFKSKRSK